MPVMLQLSRKPKHVYSCTGWENSPKISAPYGRIWRLPIERTAENGEAVVGDIAAMIQGKQTPPGVYQDFFEELLALARKHKCSALSVRVTRRNDPTTQMDWTAPVDEALAVFVVKGAE